MQIISEGEKNHSTAMQLFSGLKAQTVFIPPRFVTFANNKESYRARSERGHRKMVAYTSDAVSYDHPGKSQ